MGTGARTRMHAHSLVFQGHLSVSRDGLIVAAWQVVVHSECGKGAEHPVVAVCKAAWPLLLELPALRDQQFMC